MSEPQHTAASKLLPPPCIQIASIWVRISAAYLAILTSLVTAGGRGVATDS